MATITLLHGSDHVIEKPCLDLGKETNDYGKGFYCTLLPDMAREWACRQDKDGFVNKYSFADDGLITLNLLDGNHTVLNWIALLLKHRTFSIQDELSNDARNYIIRNFSVNTKNIDVIIGYRADDSYFSYAQSFINNTLSLKGLSKALTLGKLGLQTALISEKAFGSLKFIEAERVEKEIWYPKFRTRDELARATFRNDIKSIKSYKDDIFVLDILREEIKNADPRIQRIILE